MKNGTLNIAFRFIFYFTIKLNESFSGAKRNGNFIWIKFIKRNSLYSVWVTLFAQEPLEFNSEDEISQILSGEFAFDVKMGRNYDLWSKVTFCEVNLHGFGCPLIKNSNGFKRGNCFCLRNFPSCRRRFPLSIKMSCLQNLFEGRKLKIRWLIELLRSIKRLKRATDLCVFSISCTFIYLPKRAQLHVKQTFVPNDLRNYS